MTIFELGALGEFVGSIIVSVSLIVLVFQIRQNTKSVDGNKKALVAQTYQARSDQLFEHSFKIARDSEFCGLLNKIGRGKDVDAAKIDELSSSDRNRLFEFYVAHRVRMDNLVFQYEQGFLTQESYNSGVKVPITIMKPVWDKLAEGDGNRANTLHSHR